MVTPDRWNEMTMSEQAEAWSRMSDEERRAVRPDWEPDAEGPVRRIEQVEAIEREDEPDSANAVSAEKERLAEVREKSCYGLLRTLLDFAFMGACVMAVLLGLLGTVTMGDEFGGPGLSILWVGVVVFCILAGAAYQASSLLVDIADAQIQQLCASDRQRGGK